MAIRAFELYGEIDLRTAKLKSGMQQANREFTQFEAHAKGSLKNVETQFSKFGSNFGKGFLSSFNIQGGGGIGALLGSGAGNLIQNGVKALTGGLEDLFKNGMTFADDLQKWKISFENLLGGDKTKGLEHLIELLKYGHDSAFETRDVVDYAVKLEAVGIKATEAKDAIESIGGALARTGHFDQGSMQGAILAITQMLGKEKISAEEMTRQLANAGVAAPYGIAARGFNRLGYKDDSGKDFTTASIQKLGEEDRLNASAFVRILLSQMAIESKGMLDRIVGSTISGQKSILDDQKTFVAAAAVLGVDPSNTAALVGEPGGAYAQNLAKTKMRINEWSGPGASKAAGVLGQGAEKYFQFSNAMEEGTFQQLSAASGWGDMAKDGPAKFAKNIAGALGMGFSEAMKHIGVQDTVTKYMGEDIWSALSGFWEIQSPSKKTERMGEWIAEGLEIGMSKRQAGNYANMKKLSEQSPDFLKKLGEGAGRLGLNPQDLLNVFAVESSFNPGAFNKYGYAGLMQIGSKEAAHMGTSSSAISRMTPEQQLPYIFKFLEERLAPLIQAGKQIGLSELYATVGSGHATGDPNAVHMVKGGKRAAAYANNPLWDVNKDGVVKESEFGQAAMSALGAGKLFSVNGNPTVSASNPMPVQIVDFGNAAAFNPRTMGVASDFSGAQAIFGTKKKPLSRTLNDTVPIDAGTIGGGYDPLTTTTDLATTINEKATQPLIKLGEAASVVTAGLGGTKEAIEAAFGPAIKDAGKKKAKKDKLFDAAFTKEGVAGDFQGGLQSLLSGLGHDKPTSLLKQFGLGMLQDIQNRLSHDFSSMITGALFGGRGGPDQPMTGGLLSSIFGKLFGGGRASGGDVSGGRLYIAGENGPELITGPGHVYNASQTRGMISGDGRQEIYLAIGDRALGEATDRWHSQPRGRRSKFMTAKYGRKVYAGY